MSNEYDKAINVWSSVVEKSRDLFIDLRNASSAIGVSIDKASLDETVSWDDLEQMRTMHTDVIVILQFLGEGLKAVEFENWAALDHLLKE